jgi:hypothetical protein
MDTEEMRRFANTLLEVDSAGTAATLRHRRERASGIVKPLIDRVGTIARVEERRVVPPLGRAARNDIHAR